MLPAVHQNRRVCRWRHAYALGLAATLGACHPGLNRADRETLLWPAGAPGARGKGMLDKPRLYYFYPRTTPTGTAAIVASGGSYGHHGGLSKEGVGVAEWLASHGVVAVVLRYRLGENGGYNHVDFLADGDRAVRTVRAQADELGIDPERIGMFGFSAGGHLASSVATRCVHDRGQPGAADPIERESCKLAYSVLVYPVITLDDLYAHQRSKRNLLGDAQPTPELLQSLSTETLVTPDTPPAFLVHSMADSKVDPGNSVLFHDALVEHGVPTVLNLYPDGRHGVGLAQSKRMPKMATWPELCLAWLRHLKLLEPTQTDPVKAGEPERAAPARTPSN